MDNILQYIINIVVFVPIIILLILASAKLSKATYDHLGANKYVKILEKTSISKDVDIFVLKVGKEGCVILASPSNIEKLKDLSSEEVELIEKENQENIAKIANINSSLLKKVNIKKLSNLKMKNIKKTLKEKNNGKFS